MMQLTDLAQLLYQIYQISRNHFQIFFLYLERIKQFECLSYIGDETLVINLPSLIEQFVYLTKNYMVYTKHKSQKLMLEILPAEKLLEH